MGVVIEGEFDPVATAVEVAPPKTVVIRHVRAMNAQARANLNLAITELLNGKIDKVQAWLDEVAERSPLEAVKLFMELTEFVQPRLKAAQVNANLNADVSSGAKRITDMTLDEINAELDRN